MQDLYFKRSLGLSVADMDKLLCITSRVPVEGKSSMCLICMKYRIIILIIIIIRLGKLLLSYIAIHITHARMHTREHANPDLHPRPSLFAVSVRPTMTESWLGALLFDAGETMADRRLIEINNARATRYSRYFG